MLMIFPQILYAFLISIFSPMFPCQDVINNPNYGNAGQELRAEKDFMIAQPLELIDGGYTIKK